MEELEYYREVRNDVYQQAIKKAGDKGVERGRLAC